MSHPDDDPPPWVDHAPLHPSDADWTTDDDQWYQAWAEIEQRSAERWLRFWVGAARRWRWLVWFDLAWILWGVVFAVYDLATGHPWFAGIMAVVTLGNGWAFQMARRHLRQARAEVRRRSL